VTTFQRARSPEHKEQRAADLLAAARSLAAEQGARTVTLTAIATRADVHVSGVRRYFASREDILLALAAEYWDEWAAGLTAGLEEHPVRDAGELAELLAGSLAARPLFCDLQAHVPLSLEREASVEAIRSFKVTGLAAADRIAEAMSTALPELSPAAARDVVGGTTAMAATLWQVAHPSPPAARLYREDPRLGHAAVDFVPRLTRLVTALVTGLVAAG
jgi:AcrR family transcriptional regulator